MSVAVAAFLDHPVYVLMLSSIGYTSVLYKSYPRHGNPNDG